MDMNTHDAGFELKSDASADEADSDLVTKALNAFRSTVDDRLTAIEAKSAEDKKRDDRLKALETRLSRPGAGVEIKSGSDAGEIERKAFSTYLRNGAEALATEERKSLVVGTAQNGGFLVPALYGNELLKLLTQYSPIRSYARVVPIGGPSMIYPRRVAGTGLNPVAVGETDPRTGSQPQFEQVTLTAHEMSTYVDISFQLLEDNAYDLEAELRSEFAEFFGKSPTEKGVERYHEVVILCSLLKRRGSA